MFILFAHIEIRNLCLSKYTKKEKSRHKTEGNLSTACPICFLEILNNLYGSIKKKIEKSDLNT